MKSWIRTFFCLAIFAAVMGCSVSQEDKPKVVPPALPSKQAPALPPRQESVVPAPTNAVTEAKKDPATSLKAAEGTLSEDEISKFTDKWTDPETGLEWVFSANFANFKPKPTGKEGETVSSGNKVMYRLTCSTIRMRDVNGKKTRSLFAEGTCTFYITDSDGKVVLEPRAEPLRKLCPS